MKANFGLVKSPMSADAMIWCKDSMLCSQLNHEGKDTEGKERVSV